MNEPKKNNTKRNVLFLIIAAAIAFTPFFILKKTNFKGTDDKAEKMINEIKPDYKPWFTSLWKPPSTAMESLLFALEAAIGAGVIGFYIGLAKGKKSRPKEDPKINYKTQYCKACQKKIDDSISKYYEAVNEKEKK